MEAEEFRMALKGAYVESSVINSAKMHGFIFLWMNGLAASFYPLLKLKCQGKSEIFMLEFYFY